MEKLNEYIKQLSKQSYPNNSYPNNSYPNNSYPNNSYPNNSYPNNSYPNNSYPNNSYPKYFLTIFVFTGEKGFYNKNDNKWYLSEIREGKVGININGINGISSSGYMQCDETHGKMNDGSIFYSHSMSIYGTLALMNFIKNIKYIKDGKSINYTIDDIKEIIHNVSTHSAKNLVNNTHTTYFGRHNKKESDVSHVEDDPYIEGVCDNDVDPYIKDACDDLKNNEENLTKENPFNLSIDEYTKIKEKITISSSEDLSNEEL